VHRPCYQALRTRIDVDFPLRMCHAIDPPTPARDLFTTPLTPPIPAGAGRLPADRSQWPRHQDRCWRSGHG
jgi:hypothetical protein